jgi:8-oxo-dGTP pyrophosphatase MutT (NUDIX family)
MLPIMSSEPIEPASVFPKRGLRARPGSGAPVDRVRCVLRSEHGYLLVQHNARRREDVGKWGLPGGRLRQREKPKVGLRRELNEELKLRVPYLIKLGDWRHRDENHRLYGSELQHAVEWFDAQEIHAIAWHTHRAVMQLAERALLHRGFELEAIAEFERRFSFPTSIRR